MATTKPASVKVKTGFRKMSDPQLAISTATVINEMTGNDKFPNPDPDIKTLQTALDALNAAIAAQVQGGTAATARKHGERATVVALLEKEARYVQNNCNNDPAVVLSAGFQLIPKAARTKNPPAKPSNVTVDFGKAGELTLTAPPIPRVKVYEVRYAALGANNTPGVWTDAGLFSNSQGMTIGGLTSGMTYVFQVRAFGATGYGDWSDPVAHVAI
jgi:hypothetical protein